MTAVELLADAVLGVGAIVVLRIVLQSLGFDLLDVIQEQLETL